MPARSHSAGYCSSSSGLSGPRSHPLILPPGLCPRIQIPATLGHNFSRRAEARSRASESGAKGAVLAINNHPLAARKEPGFGMIEDWMAVPLAHIPHPRQPIAQKAQNYGPTPLGGRRPASIAGSRKRPSSRMVDPGLFSLGSRTATQFRRTRPCCRGRSQRGPPTSGVPEESGRHDTLGCPAPLASAPPTRQSGYAVPAMKYGSRGSTEARASRCPPPRRSPTGPGIQARMKKQAGRDHPRFTDRSPTRTTPARTSTGLPASRTVQAAFMSACPVLRITPRSA